MSISITPVAEAAKRAAELLFVALFVLLLWVAWGVSKIYNVLWYAFHPTEIVKKIRFRVTRPRRGRPPVPLSRSRRSLTLPLPPEKEDSHQQSHDQLQSLFFTKLAPEIRCMIYREIFVPSHALHVRRTHRRLCSTPCRNKDLKTSDTHHSRGFCHYPRADDGTVLRRLPGGNPRQDQILPLLCSCRRVYTEAIGLFYEANTFAFEDLLTVQALPLCMVPHRLASIRRIRLDFVAFENRAILPHVSASWEQACSVLAGIEALEELVITLRTLDSGTFVKQGPLLTLLMPLTKISASRFVVEVDPYEDPENLVGGLVGGQGVVPFTLETRYFVHGEGTKSCNWWGRNGDERPWWFPPG